MSNKECQTPDDLFQVLDKGGVYQGIEFEGYHFDIDLCATSSNTKCKYYYKDYLSNDFRYLDEAGEQWPSYENCRPELFKHRFNFHVTCFMNPPYSRDLIGPMIAKAWGDSKYCKIVCLVKVDPSTKWWATFWNYESQTIKELDDDTDEFYVFDILPPGPKPGCEVIFFPKRIKFDPPVNMEICKCTFEQIEIKGQNECNYCYKLMKHKLSGPSFASCLVIMDRRGL